MSQLLAGWRAQVLGKSRDDKAGLFTVRSIFTMTMTAQPERGDPTYRDHLILVACGGVGYAASSTPPPADLIEKLIGQDARCADVGHDALSFAILDSAFGVYDIIPTCAYRLQGTSANRAHRRSAVIIDELNRLLPRRSRILLVGAVRSLIVALRDVGFALTACDLDASLQGRDVGGVIVKRGGPEVTLRAMADADALVVAGMTLANGTIGDIALTARAQKQPVVMYCQSGASMAPHLIKDLAIAAVISEPFPNYLFPGDVVLRVFRRSES